MTPSTDDSLISTNELRNDFIKNETYRSSNDKLNLFSEAKAKRIELIIFPNNYGIEKDIDSISKGYSRKSTKIEDISFGSLGFDMPF